MRDMIQSDRAFYRYRAWLLRIVLEGFVVCLEGLGRGLGASLRGLGRRGSRVCGPNDGNIL